jgi:hypothetical protein
MSLITDKVFYNALKSNATLVDAVGDRIENTTFAEPDEAFLNEPVPYIFIMYDGMQNDGFTKDNNFEGDVDHVQISIGVTADNREQLGELMETIRQTVVDYFESDQHEKDDIDLVPIHYTLTASDIQYDPDKPCFHHALMYNCDTNP